MSMDCEMLGALLSERRRGELSADQARALESHLAGCARCRREARALESVLAAVELPPVGAAELEALRSRRVGEAPRRKPRAAGWRVPAVLMAAAAAAVLTVSVRPAPHRHASAVEQIGIAAAAQAEALPEGNTQELFPEMSADTVDETADTVEDDALSLEGPGLFGNLDG
ncbi:MAG TPA: zf-HC2 domain-containing protein [Myxococcaceae bacterium]|nr:zf-HC2 domain-containing protein [Myxococcaceae bacterium]